MMSLPLQYLMLHPLFCYLLTLLLHYMKLCNFRLTIRIGVHSGPVVAGVVGIKMPRYAILNIGDTLCSYYGSRADQGV